MPEAAEEQYREQEEKKKGDGGENYSWSSMQSLGFECPELGIIGQTSEKIYLSIQAMG